MGVARSIEKMKTLHIALAIAAMILLSCTADLDVPENVSQNVDTAQVATAGAELAQETTQDGWGASRKLLGRRDVRRRRRRRRRWWGSWRERTQKNAARERANKERGAKAERINKERAAKERSAKERSNKERAAKERASKERTRKAAIRREHSAKESNVKRERLAKERAAKAAEQAQKRRKVARERKGKEMRGKELRHKESAAKAKIAKERKAKRQEKSSKREKKAKHAAEIKAKVLKKIEQTKKKAAELTAKGKKKRAEQAAKKAKARKEKGLKLQAENDNKQKAKEKQKKAKKAEKKAKHEKVYKKGEKNYKAGKKALKKFKITHKMSKKDVATVEKWCTKTVKVAGSLDGTLAAGSKSVRKMASFAKKACAREKRAAAKAAELKKKVKTKGATFKFDTSKPCLGGSGTFKKYLKFNQRANVGVVPAGVPNVNIQLRSNKDSDAGLWTIGKHHKRQIAIVNWRTGKIKSATAASIDYEGAKIEYSGYMGIPGKHGYEQGNEYIRIKGKANVPFMMTAFGYEKGTAHIKYSWGPDKARCAKYNARKRQEKRRKFYAKRAMKKKMQAKQYKSAVKIFDGKKHGCAVAKKWEAIARTKFNKAKTTKAQATARLHKCVVKGEKTLKKGREMKAKALKKEKGAKEGKKKAVQREHQAKEQKKKKHERKSKALERSAKERNSKAVERNAKAAARERSYKHRYDNHCCCFLPVGCFGKPSCRVCGFGNHHVWPGTCITSRRCNRL